MNESQRSRFKLIAAFLSVGIISLMQPGCDCSGTTNNTTPPQTSAITSVFPADASSNALVSTSVSAVFRDDMDATTVESGIVLNLNGSPVATATPVYDVLTRTVTLVPVNDLAPGLEYRVLISSSVKDINGGSPLSIDFVWSFTTARGMQLTSKNISSVVGNNISRAADIDATGQYMVFESRATNLVAVATTLNRLHVYRKDLASGEVVLVSSDASGLLEANNQAFNPRISSNGRYVVFESTATNLDAAIVSPGTSQIYLKDLQDGSVELVSRSAALAPDDGPGAKNAVVSDDGRFVVFESAATNLDAVIASGGVPQIYLKDMVNEAVEMISRSVLNAAGDGASTNPDMSADGIHIVFESIASNFRVTADLITRIYYVDTNVVHAVVQMSVATGGAEAAASSNVPSVSDDGSTVAFHTIDALDGLDSNGFIDVYTHDRLSVVTTLVSINEAATNGGNGNSSNAQISGNKGYVVFESLASDLVSGDVAGIKDIFVRNLSLMPLVTIDRVSNPESGLEATSASDEPVISTDGRYVGFHSVEPFTAEDVNALSDVYRAHNSAFQ